MKKFEGVFTALVTPFKDGAVDERSLKSLVQFQLENGVQGFVVIGTTAESPCLTKAEKKKIFDLVKAEVAGQVPLVLGTGTNSTAETVEATKEAQAWGADAALVVVPYYNKPPQRGLVAHFAATAEAVSQLPILLYNVPGRTITALTTESVCELSKIKNIIGIKEASGDIAFGKKVVDVCGPEFLVTSGDDATFLELMAAGGRGVISVASHILPREFVRWSDRMLQGKTEARNEITKHLPLISHLFVEANPIPVKMALFLLGIIESPELRLPLVPLQERYTLQMKEKMKEAGIL